MGKARVPLLCVGDLVMDPLSREVRRGERQLALTQRELALLECFMRNAGKPLSRAAITQHVWRQSPSDSEDTNIVDVYVRHLRRKIDEPFGRSSLETVRGAGYRLRADEER